MCVGDINFVTVQYMCDRQSSENLGSTCQEIFFMFYQVVSIAAVLKDEWKQQTVLFDFLFWDKMTLLKWGKRCFILKMKPFKNRWN